MYWFYLIIVLSFYHDFTPFTAPYSEHPNIKNGDSYYNILFVVFSLVFIVL